MPTAIFNIFRQQGRVVNNAGRWIVHFVLFQRLLQIIRPLAISSADQHQRACPSCNHSSSSCECNTESQNMLMKTPESAKKMKTLFNKYGVVQGLLPNIEELAKWNDRKSCQCGTTSNYVSTEVIMGYVPFCSSSLLRALGLYHYFLVVVFHCNECKEKVFYTAELDNVTKHFRRGTYAFDRTTVIKHDKVFVDFKSVMNCFDGLKSNFNLITHYSNHFAEELFASLKKQSLLQHVPSFELNGVKEDVDSVIQITTSLNRTKYAEQHFRPVVNTTSTNYNWNNTINAS